MKLSPRQTEIVDLLASGKCAKEAAAALGITVTTVEKLLATARRRNKCRTTVQLIAARHRADVEERDTRLAGCVEGAEIVLAAAKGTRRAPVAALGLVLLLGGVFGAKEIGKEDRAKPGDLHTVTGAAGGDKVLLAPTGNEAFRAGHVEDSARFWLSSLRGARARLHKRDCRYVKMGAGGEWFDRLEDAPATCERCKRCLGEE